MNKDQILLNILNEDAKVVNKKILLKRLEGSVVTITGASGLVGLNITTALIKYNELADKKISINAVSRNKTDGATAQLFNNENVTEITCDLSSSSSIANLPSSNFIIHSAGYGQPGKFMEDKLKTLSINTVGTLNVLNAAKQNNVKKVINASSACIYGQTDKETTENDLTDPNWAYGVSKLAAEKYANIFSKYIFSKRNFIVAQNVQNYRFENFIFFTGCVSDHIPSYTSGDLRH